MLCEPFLELLKQYVSPLSHITTNCSNLKLLSQKLSKSVKIGEPAFKFFICPIEDDIRVKNIMINYKN